MGYAFFLRMSDISLVIDHSISLPGNYSFLLSDELWFIVTEREPNLVDVQFMKKKGTPQDPLAPRKEIWITTAAGLSDTDFFITMKRFLPLKKVESGNNSRLLELAKSLLQKMTAIGVETKNAQDELRLVLEKTKPN